MTFQANFAANQTITNSTGISTGITNTGNGDTLTLQEGTYNKASDRGITINKNITIQGNTSTNNVIIDAQKIDRIFSINASNVTLINLTFINGTANVTSATGGAIYMAIGSGNLTIINCTFINNSANNITGNGGAIDSISSMGTFLYVLNCTFINNSATDYGGAVAILGATDVGPDTSIFNCTFINNTAGSGGAIYNDGRLNLSGNIISGNTATQPNGGGYVFHNNESGVEIYGITLTLLNNKTHYYSTLGVKNV